MTAIALPDIDRSTLEELRKRLPDLSEIDLSAPSMEDVGRRADKAVDRLLGRSRASVWPRVLAAVGLIAILGVVAAWVTWGRRPGWGPEPEDRLATTGTGTGMAPAAETLTDDVTWERPEGSGLTASEASLTTSREPDGRA